jgi:tryptophan-rich sensory protein
MTLPPSLYGNGHQALGLVVLLGLCLGVGFVGSLITEPAVESWYPTLKLPDWRPPNSAFPIVWTALYVLMALSAWLVWRQRPFAEVRDALILFLVQLGANLAWSFLFFGLKSPLLGLLDILLLDALIAAMLVSFWRRDRLAAAMNLPYLGWVLFATALNAWIVIEN